LPGGAAGSDGLNADSRIHALLKKMADSKRFTAAICAAPKVLAAAGVLSGRAVTDFPGVLEALPNQGFVLSKEAVVADDKLVTSRGPGTAIDFALTLIVRNCLVTVSVMRLMLSSSVRLKTLRFIFILSNNYLVLA